MPAGLLTERCMMDLVERVDKAVWRMPVSALFLPILLFVVTAPLASAEVWLLPLFLIPLLSLIYVLWAKTVADAHAITVYDQHGRRRIPWADLEGFEFNGPRWAVALTMDRKRIRLPMVRPRDLPRLAAVSAGRLDLGETAEDDADAVTNGGSAVIEARKQS